MCGLRRAARGDRGSGPCARTVPRDIGRPKRAGAAFTLIELLAVVAIMGLLALVVVPRMAGSALSQTEGETAARQLVATMKLARRMAVTHAVDNPQGYAVWCVARDYVIRNGSGVDQGLPTVLPKGWTFVPPNVTVTFDVLGSAHASGGQSWLVIMHGTTEWHVHFEPATGYVWCEEG